MSFLISEWVVNVIDVHKEDAVIPAGTLGMVCGQLRGLVQVDFGREFGGPKIVNPAALELVEPPDGVEEPLGNTLVELIAKLSASLRAERARNGELARENAELKGFKMAPPRLYGGKHNGGS